MSGTQDLSHLRTEDIELKAEEIISYFDEKYLKSDILKIPKPTPLLSFMEILQDEHGVEFSCNDALGLSVSGLEILGAFTYKPVGIHIDKSLINDNRFQFTLGHELGHLVFHRKTKVDMDEYNTIHDTKNDFKTGKKMLISLRDWIEWQANKFASAVILPRATITTALITIQKEIGIRRRLGKIHLNKDFSSLTDYHETINKLAKCYNVNKTNIECRLKDLNILIDRRNMNINHVSALLKEGI